MLSALRSTVFFALVVPAPAFGGEAAPAAPPGPAAETPVRVAKDADADLPQTRVTAHLQQKHEAGKNLLWCAAFQAAWDELSGVLKGPVQLEGKPEMAEGLNARLASKDDLDPAAYVARAGVVRDGILDAIRADVKKVFGGRVIPALLPGPADVALDDIVAYAVLCKSLEFETPLCRDAKPLRFGDASVEAFGIWAEKSWEAQSRQVRVLRCESAADFLVSLATKDPKDRLLVARMAPGATLRETVETAVKRAGEGAPSALRRDDVFKSPVLGFDVTRNYREIVGRRVLNAGFDGYFVRDARQNARFAFDEKGASLKSEGLIRVPKNGHAPRILVCDGPFLVLMMREGAKRPYFALWVENAELMAASGKGGR